MTVAEDVVTAIEAMVAAVNAGDMAVALAAFGENPVIIEDIPPFQWRGPEAVREWLGAMGENARRLGVSAIGMTLLARLQVRVEGDKAYAAFAGRLDLTMAHSVASAPGQLAFTLVRRANAWRIEGLAWSGQEPG